MVATESQVATIPQNRDESNGRFVPGNLANPGGRPAVRREFVALCRAYAEEPDGGVAQLVAMARDKTGIHYFRANELLLAYAYGKPSQKLEVGGDGVPIVIVEVMRPG